jgi:hypothetical protein
VRFSRAARELVVRTADWPGLSQAYRAIYQLQSARAARALERIPGIEGLLLRGSARTSVRPGLSDVDLVVLLAENRSAAEELATVQQTHRAVRHVNRGAPLVRDVHLLAHEEQRALARLCDGFYSGFQSDLSLLFGASRLPPCRESQLLVRESLLRDLWYWVSRIVRNLFDADHVGRELAARSMAKAEHNLEALERGAYDLHEVRRTFADHAPRAPVQFGSLLALMKRLDAVVPDAPELEADQEWSPHPSIERLRPFAEEWMRPFEHSAISGALLSVEGAREHDLRLYAVIDPDHPRAADALGALSRRLRERPFPSFFFARFAWPLVVTRRQLERPVFLRWTAVEPLARLRHGVVLFGEVPKPHASLPEMQRALALDLVNAATHVRDLAGRALGLRECAHLMDLDCGVLPALEHLLESGELSTSYRERHLPSDADSLKKALSRASVRERIYESVRAASRDRLEALTTRALQEADLDADPFQAGRPRSA